MHELYPSITKDRYLLHDGAIQQTQLAMFAGSKLVWEFVLVAAILRKKNTNLSITVSPISSTALQAGRATL